MRLRALATGPAFRRALLLTTFLASITQAAGTAGDLPPPDTPPTVVSTTKPTYPPDLRAKNVEGKVIVQAVVLPDGSVTSAVVVGKADPELAAAAVASVSQWKFNPGQSKGAPVATKIQVPVEFNLSKPPPINIAVQPLRTTVNIRSGVHGVILPIEASGDLRSEVRAGRVLLTKAVDDAGDDLKQEGEPKFYHETVGSVQGDQSQTTSRQPISLTVVGVSPQAKTMTLIDATLELFVPGLDPDATVIVSPVSRALGVPIDNPILKAAGITLVVYDRETALKMAAAKTPEGPQDYDTAPMFGEDYIAPGLSADVAHSLREGQKHLYDNYPPAFRKEMEEVNSMSASDVAIGSRDRDGRIVGMEFQSADGKPLIYNHNGRYHSGRAAEQKSFDVFDLRIRLPKDARLVCWVLTKRSVMSVPLKIPNLPLPPVMNFGATSPPAAQNGVSASEAPASRPNASK